MLEPRRTKGRIGERTLAAPIVPLAGHQAVAEQQTRSVVNGALPVVFLPGPQHLLDRIGMCEHDQILAQGKGESKQWPIPLEQADKGLQEIALQERCECSNQPPAGRTWQLAGAHGSIDFAAGVI